MHGLAEHLGVTTPALYSHVGGREDVLDLVRTELVARIGSFQSPASTWRPWLEDFAQLVRQTLAPSATAVLGDLRNPGTVGHIHLGEPGLALLMDAGLGPAEASFCVWLVFRVAISAGPAGEPSFSGFVGDTAHLLVPAGDALPATAAVHAALVAGGPPDTFAFDLGVVLDGIAQRIAAAAPDRLTTPEDP